jgi:hypothetical protein
MFATKALTIASLILVGAKAFEVSTPSNAFQCGDTPITVTGATGQYHLSVIPATNPCDSDALFESDAITDGSYIWKANLPAGTEVVIFVDDDAGNEAWSGAFTVGAGDSSCLSSSTPASSATPSSSPVDNAYTSQSTPTNVGVKNVSTSPSSTPTAPANAQDNKPSTGAAFSNTQASVFTILAAMGVVAIAL